MRQLRNFGDRRNVGWCVHCGGPGESADHNPSKVFLDEPLPENLPVSPSCLSCNASFSLDEEYLACFIECVISGTTEPSEFTRSKPSVALFNSPKLRTQIELARQVVDESLVWQPRHDRVERILLKLARGHVAFELNEPRLHAPDFIGYRPLTSMTDVETRAFEGAE